MPQHLAPLRRHDDDVGDVGIAQCLVSDLSARSPRGFARPFRTPDDHGPLSGAFAAFFGGWLTDWLVKTTGSQRVGRTAQAMVGGGLSAIGILAGVWSDSTVVASAFIALVAFGVQLQLPSWWACATKVSGRHLGALFGLMNMMGGVGRLLSQLSVGGFADWRKSLGYTGRDQWDPALYISVVIALSGMVLWAFINPEKTVDDKPVNPDVPPDDLVG